MKKIITSLIVVVSILLCLPAMGQQITNAEYFFDTDPGFGNGTAITLTSGDSVDVTMSISTTGLSVGYHALYIRVQNANGTWSLYAGRNFYISPTPPTSTQTEIANAEYFFDTDPGVGNGTALPSFTAADSIDLNESISATGLGTGIHSLFIRCENEYGKWSLYAAGNFYVNPAGNNTTYPIVYAEYFYDTDPGVGNGTVVPPSFSSNDSVDVTGNYPTTGLGVGPHSLFIRTQNSNGKWSLYAGRNFSVSPANNNNTPVPISNAEYFFDTDPGVGNGTAISSFAAADSIDISTGISVTGLSQGIHALFIRVKNQNGNWSLYSGNDFYVTPPPPSQASGLISTAEYFFDTDPGLGNGTAISSFSAADSIDLTPGISVTGLSTGFHSLFIRVQNAAGSWSQYAGRNFYIYPTVTSQSVEIAKAEFFFDTDPGVGNGYPVSPNFAMGDSIDVTANMPTSQITTNTVSTAICPGTNVSVPYTITGLTAGTHHLFVRVWNQQGVWSLYTYGTFTDTAAVQANTYTAQLSDSSGSFNNSPTTIGTLNATTTGTISATIPLNAIPGIHYRIRVIRSNPANTGTDNGSNITLWQLPNPVITLSGPTSFCQGNSVNLDAGAYVSFLWNNSNTNEVINVSSAGNYVVTITDTHGCIGSASQAIVVHALPNPSITSHTNVSCYNGSNGSATATVTTGQSPYSYSWTGGETTDPASNLASGPYTVLVTDLYTCTATASITITQPTQLTTGTTHTNVSCFNGNNGSINLTVNGGIPGYSYSWSNTATTQNIASLSIGTYSVTATDANLCTVTTSVTITQPTQLTAGATHSNVSCYNGNNGSINLTVNGGIPSYTYVWSNITTTQNITSLIIGTYSVTATDANLCTVTTSVTITQPTQLTAGTTHSNVSCFNGNNGSISLTVNGGIPSYIYSWSNTATTQNIASLIIGTYSVTATDANQCTVTTSVSITQPTQLTAGTTHSNVSCFNGNNGSINLTVNGGIPSYTYSWSNTATTQNIASLIIGTYSVTATDANLCTVTTSVTITQPTQLTAGTTHSNVSCFNRNNGSINLTVNGGIPSYSYSWSNSATTQNISNLTNGTYSVTAIDANLCTITTSVTITQPTQLTAGTSHSNVSCFNGNNGSISLTVNGGIPSYTYVWSNTATTQNIASIIIGTYSVTATDANLCTVTTSVTITQPTQLTTGTTHNNVSCFNGNNGSINLTVNGGIPSYSYVWSNNATTQNISTLSIGTYSITSTDANLCTVTTSVTITQPTQLTAGTTQTNVSCFNGNNGSINLIVNGGIPSYTYVWSNSATGQNIGSLSIGTYSVTVTDGNLCTAMTSVTITQPTALNVSGTTTNVSYNGGNDGAINLSVSGGIPFFNFNWSNGATTQNINTLTAGSYQVTTTDANLCSATNSFTITQPSTITINSTVTNVSCNDGTNGAVSVTISGGITPYSYNWSNGATTQNISSVSTGTFSITVTDNNNIVSTNSFVVTQPSTITINPTATNISCNGYTNGSVNLSVTGGVSSYHYLWSNSSTLQNISGLNNGTYTVTVIDGNSCTAATSVIITQPDQLTLGTANSNVSCYNGTNGFINLTANGGVSFYTYSWSNSATTQNITGLTYGIYSVTVSDGNGCTTTTSVTITQPSQLSASTTQSNVSCFNGNNGSINLTANGGTITYSYSWNNGATSQNITGLNYGTYSVTITDGNLCTAATTATITQPAQLTLNTTATNVSCYNGNNGSVNLNVNGGVSSYSYSWSNSASTQNISSLTNGTYSVTVTDGNLCTTMTSATITQPTQITLGTAHTNVSCYNGSSGSINLTANGGVSSYSYSWSNSATSQSISSLHNGTYSVTVTDGNSCTAMTSVAITQPTLLSLSSTHVNVSCFNGNNGSINLTASGGISSYSYLWNNSSTTQNRTALTNGIYSVTVSDGNSCTATTTVIITQPTALNVSGTVTNVSSIGGNDGAVALTVSGGTSTYIFIWSNSTTTQSISALYSGVYNVTVTDAHSCSATSSFTVTQPSGGNLTITGTVTNATCNGGTNGSINITISGGSSTYSYLWSNGATMQNLSGITAGNYTVTVSSGSVGTASFTVTQPSAITFTTVNSNVSECGTLGFIQVSASGGTGTKTYSDNNGSSYQSSSSFLGLNVGTYTVKVKDGIGCVSALVNEVISTYASLSFTTVVVNASSCTTATGKITVTASGGAGMYNYSDNGGTSYQTSNVFNNLMHGTYSIKIKDIIGCTSTINAVVVSCPGGGRIEDNNSTSSNSLFLVYPNPTTDKITVVFYSETNQDCNLRLMDVSGRIIMDNAFISLVGENQFQMNLSELDKGIYMFILQREDTIMQRKIVVQ